MRRHLDDPLAGPASLVEQHLAEHPPAAIEDLPVQPRLLADLLARRLDRASGRYRHVPDLEVLQYDDVMVLDDLCRDLVELVFLPSCMARLHGPQFRNRPAPVGRAILLPRNRLLELRQELALPGLLDGRAEYLSVRGRNRDRHPAVDLHDPRVGHFAYSRYRGMPMAAFADDRDRLDLPAQLAVQADPDRPKVGLALSELWRV